MTFEMLHRKLSERPALLAVRRGDRRLLRFSAMSGSQKPSLRTATGSARSAKHRYPSLLSRTRPPSHRAAFPRYQSVKRTSLDVPRQRRHSVNVARRGYPRQSNSLMPMRNHNQRGDPAAPGISDLQAKQYPSAGRPHNGLSLRLWLS